MAQLRANFGINNDYATEKTFFKKAVGKKIQGFRLMQFEAIFFFIKLSLEDHISTVGPILEWKMFFFPNNPN
jgi:hypothetical protein